MGVALRLSTPQRAGYVLFDVCPDQLQQIRICDHPCLQQLPQIQDRHAFRCRQLLTQRAGADAHLFSQGTLPDIQGGAADPYRLLKIFRGIFRRLAFDPWHQITSVVVCAPVLFGMPWEYGSQEHPLVNLIGGHRGLTPPVKRRTPKKTGVCLFHSVFYDIEQTLIA